MGKQNPVQGLLVWGVGIGSLALFSLIMLILFGNLSGNVGFAANSQGANDTNNFIGNYTTSVTNVGKQLPTVGTILGVALLLLILIAVLVYAVKRMSGVAGGSSGGDSGTFG